jgi:ABC-type Mn2+/Zn2+ transport system ATPase subunit
VAESISQDMPGRDNYYKLRLSMTLSARFQNKSEPELSWAAIRSVDIKDLFGRYSYRDLRFPVNEGDIGPVAVLYGDNGSGKTTILKLLYSALSARNDEGNRTYLARCPFSSMVIHLYDGSSLSIIKQGKKLRGSYRIFLEQRGERFELTISAAKDLRVFADRNPKVLELSERLKALQLELLFLQDNRIIRSSYDLFANSEPGAWPSAGIPRLNETNELIFDETDFDERSGVPRQDIETAQQINLIRIIAAVNSWLRRKAYQRSSTGDEDASNVYLQMIKALSYRGKQTPRHAPLRDELLKPLLELSTVVDGYQKYGLVGAYPVDSFIEVLRDADEGRLEDIGTVLSPYVNSVITRLNALSDVHSMMETFEEEMQNYLKDKRVSLHLDRGIRFFDSKGAQLDPASLSSGERQLIFLFCAALLSRAGRCIIMIDEPELSLNVKWQRLLVSSLSHLTKGATTQFVMASHSIEIISQHRNAIVPLGE